MTYELAKKLKDAGFPQDRKLGGKVYFYEGRESQIVCEGEGYECDCTTESSDGYGMGGGIYAPTLSGLIEACGEKFLNLFYCAMMRNNWWAECGCCYYKQGAGTTPEEAVANLWLELNK